MPTDAAARERLREAQVAEARAVAGFFAARGRVTAAASGLDEAERRLAEATGRVIAISGSDRAMTLLGIEKTELRAILTPKSAR